MNRRHTRLLLSLALTLALCLTLFSVSALAVDDNPEGGTTLLSGDDAMENNLGTVKIMRDNSTIENNSGTVDSMVHNSSIANNSGEVTEMSSESSITNNSGTVGSMVSQASIENNSGTVGSMTGYASIENNSGNVRSMNGHTYVENNTGTIGSMIGLTYVANNSGTIGSMSDNTYVENNYGGLVPDLSRVRNNYFGVEIDTENAEASDKSGFTVYDGKDYLKDDDSARSSVTVTPAEGYAIDKPVLDAGSGTMDAAASGNGWRLTFSGLTKNIKLSIIGKLLQTEPEEPDEPDEPTEPTKPEEYSLEDAFARFNRRAVSAIRNAPENGTATVEAGNWINFLRSVPEALAERPDVTLEIHYGGETLTVPAGTDLLGAMGDARTITFAEIAELIG